MNLLMVPYMQNKIDSPYFQNNSSFILVLNFDRRKEIQFTVKWQMRGRQPMAREPDMGILMTASDSQIKS